MPITREQVEAVQKEFDCSMMEAKRILVDRQTNEYIDKLFGSLYTNKESLIEAVAFLLTRARPPKK